MNTKNPKNPEKQPILLISAGKVSQYGDGVSATVSMEFRYRRDDCDQLQSYWLVKYDEAGAFYDGLSCECRIDGDPRKRGADEFNDAIVYPLQYGELCDLNEQKLSQMLKTLKRFNRKLNSMKPKQGSSSHFSEYIHRIAEVAGAKEIAIAHYRYSIEEGIVKIDDLLRDVRRRCLEMAGNANECIEEKVQKWCKENGYSEPTLVDGCDWWAFPANGIMQVCISHLI
jgi:hypothetical protein